MHAFSKTCLFALCIGLVGRSVAFSASSGAVSTHFILNRGFKTDRPRCIANRLRMQERENVAEPIPVKTTESKSKSASDENNFYAKVGG
jgi:hypothetical protein